MTLVFHRQLWPNSLGLTLCVMLTAHNVAYADPSVKAAPVRPNSFAQGRQLTVPAGIGLASCTLPHEVLAAVEGDLNRLAVFNSNGEIVPYSVRSLESSQLQQERAALGVFSVHAPAPRSSHSATLALELAVAADGSVHYSTQREANPANGAGPAATSKRKPPAARTQPAETSSVTRYLLDASALKAPIERLHFDFEAGGNEAEIFWNLQVSAANQLEALAQERVHPRWTVTLARLKRGSQTLEANTLETPGLDTRYLAIDWQGSAPATLTSVSAELAHRTLNSVLEQRSVSASVTQQGDQTTISYDIGAVVPLRRLHFVFPQANSLAQAVLRGSPRASTSSEADAASEMTLFSGSLFHIQHNGVTFDSPALEVSTRVRYLNLEPQNQSSRVSLGLAGGTPPLLELAYVRPELRFVAQGNGPFTLAYGASTAMLPHAADALNALSPLETVPPVSATLGEPFTLGGAAALIAPNPSQPRTPWALWVALGLALLTLGLMVRALFKQVKA